MEIAKGTVYCIRSENTDKVYIGSTKNPILKRFGQHLTTYKQKQNNKLLSNISSFEVIEKGNASIEILEEIINCNIKDLLKLEKHYINKLSAFCVNKKIPTRTNQEYKRDLLYRDAMPYNCICGRVIQYKNHWQHKKSKIHLSILNII